MRKCTATAASRSAGRILCSIMIVVVLHSTSVAEEDSPPAKTSDETTRAKEFREYAQRTASAYEIRVEADDAQPATLLDQSLLRWSNPVDARVMGQGELFLWTAEGRPAAVLALYRYTDAAGRVIEHHEFCSLALRGLTADETANGKGWAPENAGVAFAPIPDAQPPHEVPRLRLSQMRELAARFMADKITRQEVQRTLRLMRTPLHRYNSGDTKIVDGALFAFVEGNDPEVFLMIEAQAADGGHAWHYAFARMNSVQVRGFHGERLVWEAPQLPWGEVLNRPDKTYTALTKRVE